MATRQTGPKRVRYTYACGHITHHYTNLGRNLRLSGPCGACRRRAERAVPVFLDNAHQLFANMGKCIGDAAAIKQQLERGMR
jgi:hypothetical protein